jgi:outer membrane cobalamin receptor
MRFTKMFLPAILLICLLFSPSGTEAQESVDYWEFSLDDLLNANVSTVSKKKQSISEAPAIVSVITEAQIKELGVQSLTQLMAYIPGFTVIDTYWKPGIITARGIKMTLYNDKILMLINGVPAYDAAALEHYLDTVPLMAVKRVEIIRGPGSTLYGTNAFAAVINVITKDGKELDGVETAVSFGSFGKREVGLVTGGTVGELEYFFSGQMTDDDGETKDFTDETNTDGRINYENDVSSLLTTFKYKEFKVDLGYSAKRYGIVGPTPRFSFGNNGHIDNQKAVQSRFYINGVYEKEINDKMSAKAMFRYDNMDKWRGMGNLAALVLVPQGFIDTTTAPDYGRFGGRVIQSEIQASYMMSENLSFLGGVAGESRITDYLSSFHDDLYGENLLDGSTQDLPITTTDYGVYLQADGSISKFGYVAGVRANYLGVDENIYFTPRAGVVYNHSKKTSLKLLYGQAFRSPGPQENYYQVPGVVYGADAIGSALKPEFISSTEVALDQQFLGKYNIRLNGFMTQVSDVIWRRDPTVTDGVAGKVYDNKDDAINITGVESELRGYPMEALSFFVNMTFKTSVDDVTDEDIDFTSNITSSGGVTWKGISKLSISPNYQFVGERVGNRQYTNGDTSEFTVDPFFLLNLRVAYQLSDQLELAFVGQNLLDEEYFYPEQVRVRIDTIPGGPSRAMFVTMSYKN